MLPALCLAGWDMPLQNLCFQGFEWAYGRIWVTSLGDNRCLFYSSCDVRGREMWGRQTRYKETIQGLLWGINKCHACVYSVCVLQTKRWAPGLDSSCNYQSKLRSFSRMFDTTRRSSLPWRSHFLRNLSCSFSRKTTSSLWRGRNRRKERDGPCDVVKKPMNCIGRLTLKTKRACANTFVITDRHMAETQTWKPNAHTCTHTHIDRSECAVICRSVKIHNHIQTGWYADMATRSERLTPFTQITAHAAQNYLPQRFCKRPKHVAQMTGIFV